VRGLTTAASLWCTAAVGMACGFGMYSLAIFTTVLVLFALIVLGLVADRLPARITRSLVVVLPATTQSLVQVQQALVQKGMKVRQSQIERDFQTDYLVVTFAVSLSSHLPIDILMEAIKDVPGIRKVSIA
jgi:putative Mg2+ transporter-C (MgtC) family protein